MFKELFTESEKYKGMSLKDLRLKMDDLRNKSKKASGEEKKKIEKERTELINYMNKVGA